MLNYDDLKAYVNDKYDEMVEFLERIISIESGPDCPGGVDEIIDVFIEEFDKLGMDSRIIEYENSGNALISVYTPEGVENSEPIVLSGHMDTVFYKGTIEEHPFRMVSDKLARGAGIMDMKGGLVIALYTLKALVHFGYKKHPIKMLFVGDEETLHRFSDARDMMVEELTGARAMLNYEPALEHNYIGISRKGGGMIRIDVEGVGAHSGAGAAVGRSAIVDLAHKIVELESRTDLQRGKLINCGLIEGGISANTIPGKAHANLAIRFPSEDVRDEILRDLEEVTSKQYIQGTKATLTIEAVLDVMEYTKGVQAMAKHFKGVADDLGFEPLVEHASEGYSDAALGVVAGVPTLCSMGIVGSGAHTLDEEADITTLVDKTILSTAGIFGL